MKDDQGYYIWSFQGRILKRVNLKNFLQLLWRPRPASLLNEPAEKEIKKSLKKYYGTFETKDRLRLTRASKDLLEKRAKLREEFVEYRTKRIQDWHDLRSRRMELRNRKFFQRFLNLIKSNFSRFILDVDTDNLEADRDNFDEEQVEFLVKEETKNIE